MRRMGWSLLAIAVAGAAALVIWRPWRDDGAALEGLTWGEVQRGDLEVVVSSTGSIEALDSVEVGTQVSGTITEIRVDFNDRVNRGDVLAVIDTSLLDASLRDARAGLDRARAELEQARAEQTSRRALFDAGLLSETEYRTYETALVSQRAALTSAEAQVERAQQNRRNAVIVSPIDGVVIERAVEQGQTVAASFSTPRLFLLARDLRQMRILAEVDEGDIGQVRLDQEVRFQVAAQPDRDFRGKVRQIRLQPKVDQNVVKYTVVVDAANDEGLLLPGMTATLDFVVEMAHDVLTVPTAATRVRPTEAMLKMLPAQSPGSNRSSGPSGSPGAGGEGRRPAGAGGARGGDAGWAWRRWRSWRSRVPRGGERHPPDLPARRRRQADDARRAPGPDRRTPGRDPAHGATRRRHGRSRRHRPLPAGTATNPRSTSHRGRRSS